MLMELFVSLSSLKNDWPSRTTRALLSHRKFISASPPSLRRNKKKERIQLNYEQKLVGNSLVIYDIMTMAVLIIKFFQLASSAQHGLNALTQYPQPTRVIFFVFFIFALFHSTQKKTGVTNEN